MKKKVFSAVALAAVAASFASAEAKFSVNFRTGIDVISHTLKSNTTLFNASSSNRTTSDALSFKGSADFGGVELEIDPLYAAKSGDGSTSLTLEKYNGWINFGKFTFKAGAWDARAVGRVNADLGNHEGKFWGEIQKPGLAATFKGTGGLGVDISQQSNKNLAGMASWVDKDMGLEVRAGYIDTDLDKDYNGGDTTAKAGKSIKPTDNTDGNSKVVSGAADSGEDWDFYNSQWFFEAGYTIKDIGRVMFSSKFAHKDQAFALFFEPKLPDLKALTALVGFTTEIGHGTLANATKDDVAVYAFGLEGRVRYAIDEKLSVTAMANYSFGDQAAIGKEAKAWTDKPTNKAASYAAWGMLNATYRYNETFSPFMSVIYTSGSSIGGNAMVKDALYTGSLRIYPGVEIYNTKNANIITGLVVDLLDINNHVDEKFTKTFTVPVLMRVKM